MQPHKKAVHDKTDATFVFLLALFFSAISGICIQGIKTLPGVMFSFWHVVVGTLAIVPLIYMTCVTLYWICSRMRQGRQCFSRVRAWRRGYNNINSDMEDSLPHRVHNPDQYPVGSLQDPVDDSHDSDSDRENSLSYTS